MPAPRTVLLTGAAGGIGTMMRERLPGYGYALRLFDVRRPAGNPPHTYTADLADTSALAAAVRGADAVLHLAGIPHEAPFEEILHSNIRGTHRLYEAVRAEGVRRVVFASSNHAVGFTPLPAAGGPPIPEKTAHRPDTFYGLSKTFGEDLAQLYWDRHGIETVSVRIGSCAPRPGGARMLGIWLSPGDAARLFHAALTAEGVGHRVVHGSSDNTRGVWDLSGARALGYAPQDDSEAYAAGLLAAEDRPPPSDPSARLLGGDFCAADPPGRR